MIFISYRVSDSLDMVGRLESALTSEVGEDAVFRDETRLKGSQDWPGDLERAARLRRVMLVVIGKEWKPPFVNATDISPQSQSVFQAKVFPELSSNPERARHDFFRCFQIRKAGLSKVSNSSEILNDFFTVG